MATQAIVPKLESQTLSLLEKAQQLQVKDQMGYDKAVELLRAAKDLRAEINDTFDPIIKKAHAAHKEAVGKKKEREQPVILAEGVLKIGIGTFMAEQERLRLEAQRKAEEDARKQEEESRLQQAIQAEEQGASKEDVQAIVEAPSTAPPPVVAPTYQKAPGISARSNWKAEVVNMAVFVKAAAKNPNLLKLLLPNQVALNAMAVAQHDALNIPGVRSFNDAGITARR